MLRLPLVPVVIDGGGDRDVGGRAGHRHHGNEREYGGRRQDDGQQSGQQDEHGRGDGGDERGGFGRRVARVAAVGHGAVMFGRLGVAAGRAAGGVATGDAATGGRHCFVARVGTSAVGVNKCNTSERARPRHGGGVVSGRCVTSDVGRMKPRAFVTRTVCN